MGTRQGQKLDTESKMIRLKRVIILLFFILAITGCKSCYSIFYKNNERNTLNISIDSSKLKSSFIEFYIDSVVNKNKTTPDSILYAFTSDGKLREDERIINFISSPKEAYLIILSSTPCQIYYIYNSKYSNEAIGDIHVFSTDELNRIKKRFNNEILRGAEDYKKMYNIPDSTAYDIR